MTILLSAGRAAAKARDSWLVRRLRPSYESLLGWSTAGHGIPWEINSVACRIDSRTAEGFEIAALSGARRLLSGQTKRPGVVVEMHPDSWAVAGTSRASAEALFRELGLCPEPLSGQTDPLGTHAHVWLRPA